jgi:hypothetical protein
LFLGWLVWFVAWIDALVLLSGLVFAGGWLTEVVFMGVAFGLPHIHFLTTLHSFFTDSNTVCHPHMANTFFLLSAIPSSSREATAELSMPLLARFSIIAHERIHEVDTGVCR